MIPKEAVVVRKFIETDEAFVYSTWLRNYKHSSYFAKRIRPHTFFKGHWNVVNHLLAKPTVIVFIAHPKEDEETILGYLACELADKPIVHFIFVKDAFRNMGIATALFEHAKIDPNNMFFTHWTIPVDDFMNKYGDMIYDPYKL